MSILIEHIEFKRNEIPVSKKVEIDGVLYTIEVQFNEVGNFFTMILYDDDEKVLLSSKLVYKGDALHVNNDELPGRKLVPLNIQQLSTGNPDNTVLNFDTFDEKVKLYLI
jgi:hypothetical protein